MSEMRGSATERRAVRTMRELKHLGLALLGIACGLATLSTAAHSATTGTIKGVVINQATHRPQSGVVVRLSGANSDGTQPIVEKQTTGRDGRFEFTDLATGDKRFYAIDGIYQKGLFAGRPVKLPANTTAEPVITSRLKVWPTTTDPTLVGLAHDDIFAVGNGDNVGIVESDEIVNASPDHAYIGRGGDTTDKNVPTFGFSLPVSARSSPVSIADSDIEIPKLVRTDFGFGATVAIPPGPTRVTFTYKVPSDGGTFDLTRVALYPIVEFSVFAENTLTVSSNRLKDQGLKTIGTKTYRRYSSGGSVDSGDPIQVELDPAPQTSMGLIAGAVGGGIAILLGLLIFFMRFRRGRKPRPAPQLRPDGPIPTGRDDIIVAIAQLDLRHDAGEISDDDHRERRERLKRALESFAELRT